MSEDHKWRLQDYLTKSREAVIWKAEGLSEYDSRRPLAAAIRHQVAQYSAKPAW